MKATKQLVENILHKASHYAWSLQGLGMLRLYLSDETRLHVWDSSFKIQGVSPLHNHPWDFESEVVAGLVRQFRYHPLPEKSTCLDQSIFQPFNAATIKCGENAAVVGKEEEVYLRAQFESYAAGETYTQKKDEIHESFPEDGTVTIVERVFHPNRENARVFWRGNAGFKSAEPRPATPEEVYAITRHSLDRWF